MNDILSKNIVDIIKDIKESKENVKEETVSIINRIFFSYSKANLKANIVLVLGGLSDIRAIVGTNLSKKNNIPIIFSGGVFHSKFGATEAEYYKKIGIGHGLKDGLIYIENDSTNTYENFLYSLDLIKEIIQKDIINIFVVSNSIHLPRAILIGNEIINKNNYNMKLIPYASDQNDGSWMKNNKTRGYIINELNKILTYNYKNSLNIKFKRFASVMTKMVQEKVFPGATYAVLNKDYSMLGVCGNKSLYPLEKNTLNTLYDMASLTKVIVTNTIVLRMLQADKINLNDKIGKYLKEYDYLDITIYNLVTHSSGLKSGFSSLKIESKEEFILALKNIKLDYIPGTKCIYSDIGFVILGMVIEKIYNMKLDEIADIEVFKPLSMKRATFHPNVKNCAPTEQTIDRGLIRGIVHDETAFYSGRILGHAGLFCDINDACKFVKMILNDGMVSNKVYLEKKYIDMLFHPEVLDIDGVKRSIGWVVGKVNSTGNSVSENTISHNGFTGTNIVIDRDNKIGIVVLSNRVHPTRENNLLLSRRKEIIGSIYNKIYIEKDTNLN